uniref:Uncharacterized protein n=1 Tax=Lepeophtheirus salmonis TaxID=72036 RepID=A0A0K2SZ41_LEPSM
MNVQICRYRNKLNRQVGPAYEHLFHCSGT